MVVSTNLGFPRIGRQRELKKATESYWKGEISKQDLQKTGAKLRKENWLLQKEAGLDLIPSNDFSFYDQVLDMCAMVGAVPSRYGWHAEQVDLDTYFAMARGGSGAGAVTAMKMTKWFDTNYHYIVPELTKEITFKLSSLKPLEEFREALQLKIHTKPVLIGPVSFLLLSKVKRDSFNRLNLINRLLPVYEQLFQKLSDAGAQWIQLDEPCLTLDRSGEELQAYREVYDRLRQVTPALKFFLATYFEGLGDNLEVALELPVDVLHVDLTAAPQQLDSILSHNFPADKCLSLGVVDGRNIWKNNFESSLNLLEKAVSALGAERVMVSPSCSLIHTPIDLELEPELDDEIKNWMAFAKQKLQEIGVLTRALNEGREAVPDELEANARACKSRQTSSRIHNPAIKERTHQITPEMTRRSASSEERRRQQYEKLKLPELPTTTIGSFPQTAEIRKMRLRWRKGETTWEEYESFIKQKIREVIGLQEKTGLDVLVHGEFERNDMVEYFGEQLDGFVFTRNAWTQSYGSRYVKPPIIYGDVQRTKPMTVDWSRFAASLTQRPVKGMLTGPVTIVQWSFVRDDQSRSETCRQIALAIRDEVLDLEKSGISIIQVDEPALREGLPLRREGRQDYCQWAVECFHIVTSGVQVETQIHTHMCYSEFSDILDSIAAMDADVISMEASRSDMELLQLFTRFDYPNHIGPGVYDIHSPRTPPVEEIVELLMKAVKVLQPEQLWVNPDCGLKTRTYAEVEPSLQNMVKAAHQVRQALAMI
ncbi:5-methyltetrahydropteroyltriglutamate--homocysteine S-methyltransferase [Acidobacteria bacterium AH-259-D05]|nr:5-methyltetrahydropteroyltriglutamate--homocysteine S-methyltransferase [Acidobacteria bacterium AH-259-D05]